MKVLSLFDGISCGMVALERAGIPVERYVAYEIEPNAIKISKKNYPQIEHCGDVTTADFTQYEGFDLLIGGSPCQDLSVYKTSSEEGWLGLEGSKSNLFWHYVRALRECKPKFFLLENVASMEQKWVDVISEELGVRPIMINSSLVCAAERKRLYWTNIPEVECPEDKGFVLKDIAIPAEYVHPKYWYSKPFIYNGDDKKVQCTLQINGHRNMKEVYNLNGKCNTILCDGDGGNRQKKIFQDGRCRKLTPVEYERLQTLPDNYTEGIADSRRYTATGNGWTVDVIAHIFTYIKKQEEKEKNMELKIQTPTFPEVIEFNFEELKQEITERASTYVNLVYSDDQIADAKNDRATLNKFVKALSDERIKIKKECLKPYEDFEAKIKELDGIVNKAIKNIDSQIKAAEEQKKAEKLEKIQEYWDRVTSPEHPLTLQRVMNPKWLNATTSMKSIQEEINEILAKYAEDIATLQNLPEFSFEAVETYKTSLDVRKALDEAHRLSQMAKKKAEMEAEKARLAAEAEAKKQKEAFPADAMNPPVEEVVEAPAKQWVRFQALMTTEDALALRSFLNSRNIEFKAC